MTTRTLPPPAAAKPVAGGDTLDIRRQLDELKELRDGWLDGEGLTPDHAGLDWLAEAAEQFYDGDLPRPHLYPMISGGVRAEWTGRPLDASLDIDLAAKTGYWHCLNLDTDLDDDRTLDLRSAAGWQWLGDELARLEVAAK